MQKINKFKLISLSLTTVLCFGLIFKTCVFSEPISVKATETNAKAKNTLLDSSNYEMVASYEVIFQGYYQQTVNAMAEYNIEMPYSFEEFCNGYYEFDMDLNSYCDLLVAEANGTICMANYEVSTMESSIEDADYIIKGDTANPNNLEKFDPDVTPSKALQRDIYYDNSKFDYSAIKEGDIVVETSTKFFNMGHSAFVYDTNKPIDGRIHGRTTYIQCIEAVAKGVQFGILDDKRMVDFGVVILRPYNTSEAIVEKAKYFHWCQLGKLYDIPLETGRVNTSINSAYWYCSELTVAAYFYANVIIAYKNDGGWIFPFDLIQSENLRYVSFSKTLDIKLCGKVDGKWKIRVYNYTGEAVNMYYNSRLAFFDDAKNWKGLRNVNTTPIKIYNSNYEYVYISTNIFATTAAISYTIGSTRYITYCNGLNSDTLRMKVFKNVI